MCIGPCGARRKAYGAFWGRSEENTIVGHSQGQNRTSTFWRSWVLLYSRCDNRPGSEEIRKWDRVTTVLRGMQGRRKSKKEKLRLVAAALAAVAQEGCFDASLPFH